MLHVDHMHTVYTLGVNIVIVVKSGAMISRDSKIHVLRSMRCYGGGIRSYDELEARILNPRQHTRPSLAERHDTHNPVRTAQLRLLLVLVAQERAHGPEQLRVRL